MPCFIVYPQLLNKEIKWHLIALGKLFVLCKLSGDCFAPLSLAMTASFPVIARRFLPQQSHSGACTQGIASLLTSLAMTVTLCNLEALLAEVEDAP